MKEAVKSERGASAVEYGLLVVAIAAVIAAVVFGLGGQTLGMFHSACDNWKSHDTGSSSTC